MQRTSTKASILAMAFFFAGIALKFAAESYEKVLNPAGIKISGGGGRPWNQFDYLAVGCFLFFFALLVVAYMFLAKED